MTEYGGFDVPTEPVAGYAFGGGVQVATLRLEIDGEWTAAEMASVFGTLDAAYRALSVVDAIVPQRLFHVGPPARAFGVWDVEDYVAGLSARARVAYGDLALESMHYESPGWLAFLGSLRPLKTIADFVTDWRAETSQRRRDHAAEAQAAKVLALEEEKQRMDFALALLKAVPKDDYLQRDLLVGRLMKMFPDEDLKAVARDPRLTSVTLEQAAA